ncbi:MAG: hypothetical protein HYX75_25815 [Acidobacteria bacterium]|nr:hypothetical protein [Acidobacteriota bacterium]
MRILCRSDTQGDLILSGTDVLICGADIRADRSRFAASPLTAHPKSQGLPSVVDTLVVFDQTDGMSAAVWKWSVIAAALVAGAILLDRLLLMMEARGWIYYRRKQASPGGLGNAVLSVQSMLEPGKQYVLESKQKERGQEDDKIAADDTDPDRPE